MDNFNITSQYIETKRISPFLAEFSGPIFELLELVLVNRWFGPGDGSLEVDEGEARQSELF